MDIVSCGCVIAMGTEGEEQPVLFWPGAALAFLPTDLEG